MFSNIALIFNLLINILIERKIISFFAHHNNNYNPESENIKSNYI